MSPPSPSLALVGEGVGGGEGWEADLGCQFGRDAGQPEQDSGGAVGPRATLLIPGFKAMQIFDSQDSLPLSTSSRSSRLR